MTTRESYYRQLAEHSGVEFAPQPRGLWLYRAVSALALVAFAGSLYWLYGSYGINVAVSGMILGCGGAAILWKTSLRWWAMGFLPLALVGLLQAGVLYYPKAGTVDAPGAPTAAPAVSRPIPLPQLPAINLPQIQPAAQPAPPVTAPTAAPLPTAHIIAPVIPESVPASAITPPPVYANPTTGALYTPVTTAIPTPYTVPTVIPVLRSDWRTEAGAAGGMCVVYQERVQVCDTRSWIDDATAEWYASELSQGRLASPYAAPAAPTPAACQHVTKRIAVEKDGAPIGEVVGVGCSQAEADAAADALAKAMLGGQP